MLLWALRNYTAMSEVKIGTVDDLKSGEMKLVKAGEKKLVLANIKGKYYCMNGICTHALAYLWDGVIDEDGRLTCPLHASQFDVKTGKVLGPPAIEDEPVYKVKTKGKELFVEI
jgi:nitrite reductase/ring-hydroxylating ferredoxin subunit